MTRKWGSVKTRHVVILKFRTSIFGLRPRIESKEQAYKKTILPV
jgi:hypothetical protein